MTDLREQFAGLRAEENARIRPPGAAAARQTVRRRTRRRRSAAAGLAALVVAGGFAVARTPGTSATGGWSDRPEPDPHLSVLLAQARQEIAGVDPDSPVASASAALTEPYRMDPQAVTAGDHMMVSTCAGMGSVLLTALLQPSGGGAETVAGRMRVECDEAALPLRANTVRVPVSGTLTVQVDPDEVALGRAAAAFVVQSGNPKGPGGLTGMATRRLGDPQIGPPPQRKEPVYVSGKVINKDLLMARTTTLGPGTYRFVAACADTGSIEWRLRIEATGSDHKALNSGAVSCQALKPVTTTVELDSSSTIRVELLPDTAAVSARAGWAFQIVTG